MAFNKNTKGDNKTVNKEGSVAYKKTPELELYSLVSTSFMQPKFYSGDDDISRIRKLISQVSPEFVVKLAVYAREEMHLRSIPLVLLVELAKVHNGDQLVSLGLKRVIKRADEITECLAYYEQANKRTGTKRLNKLSKQFKKGIGEAFNRFDEYQFGKYNRSTAITFKDALFLSHPKAVDEEKEILFKKIIAGELEVPYTWETRLSEAGKNDEDKKVVWEELIDSRKVGYMAMLRNLRNILDAGVTADHINKVAMFISDEEQVARSQQLPFRFLSAYLQLKDNNSMQTSMILDALEAAIKFSAVNVKGYDHNTSVVIASDVSGSMQTPVSPKSSIQNWDIGILLSMILQTKCRASITGIFGDDWKVAQMPKTNILENVINLRKISNTVGYSTNGYKVITHLIENNIKADKIMMFTDCQLWNSEGGWTSRGSQLPKYWAEYKKINPNAKLYLFDLAGYGDTPIQVNDQDVFMIAGWSDKIFNMLAAIDEGSSVVEEVNKVIL